MKKAIGPETAAILIEPIMGEGGVRVVPHTFLRALRKLCDDNGLLLVFAEIQTGVGRTGDLFAYQHSGVKPDIMTIAKALGGGFPVGACLATAEASKGMTAGTHGSTFGGNPLAMAVGNAVLDVITADGFLDKVKQNSLLFKQRLAELKDRHASVLAEVRGEGLLVGLRMIPPVSEMVDELRAENMITVAARRQCGAAAAAVGHQRGRARRGDRAHRSRLRPGSRRPMRGRPSRPSSSRWHHERQRRAALPRSHRYPEAGAGGIDPTIAAP